jgi:hypothetical protein
MDVFLGGDVVLNVELLEDHIDAAATNRVHWGTQSALATTLSDIPELGTELGLLGFRSNADWIEDHVDALWT